MKPCVLLALSLAVSSPCAAQYSFTTVDYPGAATTRLIGLNDHGEMVGHYILAGQPRHAFKYSRGTFEALDPGVLTTWGDPTLDVEEPDADWAPDTGADVEFPDIDGDELTKWFPVPEEQPVDSLELRHRTEHSGLLRALAGANDRGSV